MHSFIKFFSVFCLAVFSLLGGAFAQSNKLPNQPIVSDPNGVIDNFDAATIIPLLKERYEDVREIELSNHTAVRLQVGGAILVLLPNACENTLPLSGCVGLYVRAFFDGAPSLELVNQYNTGEIIMAAQVEENGDVVLRRYLIADFGFQRGSLIADVENSLVAIDRYFRFLDTYDKSVQVSQISDDAPAQTGKHDNRVLAITDGEGRRHVLAPGAIASRELINQRP